MPRLLPRLLLAVALLLAGPCLAQAANPLSGLWQPEPSSVETAPPATPAAGERRPGPPGGGRMGKGGPGDGAGSGAPRNGPGGSPGTPPGHGPGGPPPRTTQGPEPGDGIGGAALHLLAPGHAALLLEVTEAAVALSTQGTDAVLFVPFTPGHVEFDGNRLQARHQGRHVVIALTDRQGRHAEVHYFTRIEGDDGLVAVARTLEADGRPDKVLFERRYARQSPGQ